MFDRKTEVQVKCKDFGYVAEEGEGPANPDFDGKYTVEMLQPPQA
jgi:hypothetical protein